MKINKLLKLPIPYVCKSIHFWYYDYFKLAEIEWIIVSLFLFNELNESSYLVSEICKKLNLDITKWEEYIINVFNNLINKEIFYISNGYSKPDQTSLKNINKRTMVGNIKFVEAEKDKFYLDNLCQSILNNDFTIKLRDKKPISTEMCFCLFNKPNLFNIEEKNSNFKPDKDGLYTFDNFENIFQFNKDFENNIYHDKLNQFGEQKEKKPDTYCEYEIYKDYGNLFVFNKDIGIKIDLDNFVIEPINEKSEEILELFGRYFKNIKNDWLNEIIGAQLNENNFKSKNLSNLKLDQDSKGEFCSNNDIELFDEQFAFINKYYESFKTSFYLENNQIYSIYLKEFDFSFPLINQHYRLILPMKKVIGNAVDFIMKNVDDNYYDFLVNWYNTNKNNEHEFQQLLMDVFENKFPNELEINSKIFNFIYEKANKSNKEKIYNKTCELFDYKKTNWNQSNLDFWKSIKDKLDI